MKKALILCLAVTLVIAFAVPGFAAKKKAKTAWDTHGSINHEGYYGTNQGAQHDPADRSPMAMMNLEIDLEITWYIMPTLMGIVSWDVWDAMWGTNDSATSPTMNKGMVYYITKNYGTFIWGQWDTGKHATGIYSYAGSVGHSVMGADRHWGYSEGYYSQFNWSYKVNDLITLGFFYGKYAEGDYTTAATTFDGQSSDGDYDYYGPSVKFIWATGAAGIGVALKRYHPENGMLIIDVYRPTLNVGQHFGPFTLALSVDYYTGKVIYTHSYADSMDDVTVRSLNWELVGEYKDGPIHAGIDIKHMDGDGDTANDTITAGSLGGNSSGASFHGLLLVFKSREGILPTYSAEGGTAAFGFGPVVDGAESTSGVGQAELGINVVIVFIEYKVMKGLWVQAAVGWLQFTQTPGQSTTSESGEDDVVEDWSKAIGYEIDAGIAYQMARNLMFIGRFGLFNPGAFFEDAVGPEGDTGMHWVILYKIELSLD